MRRKFRTICCCPNILCHIMITSRPLLIFQVSMEPYWSAQHNSIFENGATAFQVAKIGTKRYIYIQVVGRAIKLKFGIKADYTQIYHWYLFWCHCGHPEFCFSFCFLCVMFFLKACPCHLFLCLLICMLNFY